jgi:hypothetical protein
MAFRVYVMPIVYKYKVGTPRIQRFLLSMTSLKALHKLRDISYAQYFPRGFQQCEAEGDKWRRCWGLESKP